MLLARTPGLPAQRSPGPHAVRAGADLLADRLLPSGQCPACRSLAHATCRYLDTLVLHLTGSELRQRYLASRGLCLPHLKMALRQVKRPAEVDLLLRVEVEWAASLRVASR